MAVSVGTMQLTLSMAIMQVTMSVAFLQVLRWYFLLLSVLSGMLVDLSVTII